jgi:hypothetical protein
LEPLLAAALWGFWLAVDFAAGAGLVEAEAAPAGACGLACAANAATHAITSAAPATLHRKVRAPETFSVNANLSLDRATRIFQK